MSAILVTNIFIVISMSWLHPSRRRWKDGVARGIHNRSQIEESIAGYQIMGGIFIRDLRPD